MMYHAIAILIVASLYYFGWLPLIAALAFGLALFKFGIAALNQEWYRTAKIQWVAMLETEPPSVFLLLLLSQFCPLG
jgi:hypothetical protein